MFRYQFVFSFLLSINLLLNLQAQDSSYFNSQFERNIFQKLEEPIDIDALEIMIALDYKSEHANVKDQIEKLYQSLDPDKLKKKKTKKQIKAIYKGIHDAKLKKYIIDADFYQLFSEGKYNCVSATALYAQILDRFDIDYEIRETPIHVYLIADPKGEKILIETTLPQNGAVEFDYKTQKQYVAYLKDNKLISESEYESNSIEKLFDQYYDTNKSINNRQLAGLLYYNRGVENYNGERYVEASKYLCKAHQIYPSTNIHFLANYAIVNALAECEVKNEFDPNLLAKLLNLNKEGSEFSIMGEKHFSYVSNELMVVHPNIEAYKNYYKVFKSELDSNININAFEKDYHGMMAYTYYMKQDFPAALKELTVSYTLNPENLEVRETILNTASKHMMNDRNHEANVDSLDKYFTIFDFLQEDERVRQYYSYCQMRVIRENFVYDNSSKGLKQLNRLEDQIRTKADFTYDPNYLAQMYVDVSNYYGRKNQLTQAIKTIKRGLEFEPSSIVLQNRLRSLGEINYQYQQLQQAYEEVEKNQILSFEESFEKYFMRCWRNTGSLTRNNEEGNYDKTLNIMFYDNNEITYISEGKTENGKYSLREKSKLLYLIPNRNKDDYMVFKVMSIDQVDLVLMPFENDKLTGEKIYMRPCN